MILDTMIHILFYGKMVSILNKKMVATQASLPLFLFVFSFLFLSVGVSGAVLVFNICCAECFRPEYIAVEVGLVLPKFVRCGLGLVVYPKEVLRIGVPSRDAKWVV